MKFQSFLLERDIALNKQEDCAKLKGPKKIDCKIEKYQDYIRDLEDAIKTSTSSDETKDLKTSLKSAKKTLYMLRDRR